MVAKGTSGEAAGASTPAVPAAAEPPDGLGKRPERTEEAGGALAETAEPVAEAGAPGGGAAAEAASAVTKKTAEEASLPADPGATVDALRKEANDRIETVQPDGSFASKSALERFKAPPDLVQGESTFKFEKCAPKALLYARESTPCTDGISHLITYAAVAPRPLTYESPEPIKGAAMPFMAVQLNTRSYGVAGESRDVIFCTIVENDTGCNAVVYDIESKKCTEHLVWRVVGGREIEATAEIKTAAQLSYIEWHKEKIKGFASGDNARASRAAAAAAEAAAKEKERERDAAASKPAKSGVGKNKASGDEADGDDEVAPVDPPPVKLLKLTRSEARAMFANKTSVHQRKKSEDSNGYRTRLHAACKAFGKKSPETSRNCDCQEFLMKALGFAEAGDDGTPARPSSGSTAGSSSGSAADSSSGSGNGSSSGSTAGSSSSSAAQLETKGWTRTPCSESGAFYYVHSGGRVQWEVPEEVQPKPKKLKPSGPPPPTAFGGAPVPGRVVGGARARCRAALFLHARCGGVPAQPGLVVVIYTCARASFCGLAVCGIVHLVAVVRNAAPRCLVCAGRALSLSQARRELAARWALPSWVGCMRIVACVCVRSALAGARVFRGVDRAVPRAAAPG